MSWVDERVKFARRLEERGLSQLTEKLLGFAKPAILLKPAKAQPDEAFRVGATKIGGHPDLPADFAWPTHRFTPFQKSSFLRRLFVGKEEPPIEEEKALAFITQIDLAAMPREDGDDLDLPRTGILSFFYDSEWTNENSYRIIWTEPDKTLVRRTPPAGTTIFQAASLVPERLLTLPDEIKTIANFTEEEAAAFEDFTDENFLFVQLLGEPCQVQNGDMRRYCELNLHKLPINKEGFRKAQEMGLDPEKSRWRLVLQVGSVEEAGMDWGDTGTLYLWMKEDDLRARCFDKVECILEFA